MNKNELILNLLIGVVAYNDRFALKSKKIWNYITDTFV